MTFLKKDLMDGFGDNPSKHMKLSQERQTSYCSLLCEDTKTGCLCDLKGEAKLSRGTKGPKGRTAERRGVSMGMCSAA